MAIRKMAVAIGARRTASILAPAGVLGAFDAYQTHGEDRGQACTLHFTEAGDCGRLRAWLRAPRLDLSGWGLPRHFPRKRAGEDRLQ